MKKRQALVPADIMIPQEAEMEKWSVIACDQHTSEPEYWERVDKYVGDEPSTLRMMLPEHLYNSERLPELIAGTRAAIESYIDGGVFRTLNDSYIYVERELYSGKLRRGLIGQIDLDCYEHGIKSGALIRSTEGIVEEKMPPRIALREGAKAELTHVLILVDDPKRTLIEPLSGSKTEMELLYDFELMEGGGHIKGYRVGREGTAGIEQALERLTDENDFRERYGVEDEPVLLFATGDGNHSLATAKACWEQIKKDLTESEREVHPARHALVEIINIWDESLEFEPINRVVFDCDPKQLLEALISYYPGAKLGMEDGHNISYSYGEESGIVSLPWETSAMAIGALGRFFEDYLSANPGRVDYVHGDDVVIKLSEKAGRIGFVLPAVDKNRFFASIIQDGAFPRKTFSMGAARDKRYYLECRMLEL